MARLDEPPRFFRAARHPVELEAQPVPVEPEPRERALDLLGRAFDLAAHVGVLDPQQTLAALLAREEPVEQERARRPDVEEAGRATAPCGHGRPGGAYRSRVFFGAHVSSAGGIHKTLDRADGDARPRRAAVHAEPSHVACRRTTIPPISRRSRSGAQSSGSPPAASLAHALYLLNLAAPDDEIYEKSRAALRNTMEVACAIEADGVVFHVGSHLGAGMDAGIERCVPALKEVLELCTDDDLAADRGLGRRRRDDRPLRSTSSSRSSTPAAATSASASASTRATSTSPASTSPTARSLDDLLDEIDERDRPRPAARAAHQRRGGSARLEPRPAREHRRRRARRRARRLPLASEAAGAARVPRGARRRQATARTPKELRKVRRAAQAMGRYRWLILAAGTLSATSLSAVQIGISAIAPDVAARSTTSASARSASCSPRRTPGMTLTLLAWGIVSDRIGERLAIVIGLDGCGTRARASRRTCDRFAALVGALAATGAFGASVNSASGRAVMHWFAAGRARARARDPAGGDPDRRFRRRPGPAGDRRALEACTRRSSRSP